MQLGQHSAAVNSMLIVVPAPCRFWVQFSSWKDSIPFLPGSLAWFGGLALQITSLYVIRHKWFDVRSLSLRTLAKHQVSVSTSCWHEV
jgi:hypothetical protein